MGSLACASGWYVATKMIRWLVVLMSTDPFVQQVRESIESDRLLADDESVIVGVSGGIDSMALLHALASMVASGGRRQLHVAHLNHGLRGEASDADAAFVEDQAARLKLPCTVETENIGASTGGGRGIGREECLLLAHEGARVVVNDFGGALDGSGGERAPAGEVGAAIREAGGEAVASHEDVTSFDAARKIIDCALENFGRLDALINNAGILRDRMLVNMSEQEWDAVVNVHLKGTFAASRHAAAYWRECSKAGQTVDARLINTTSASGIYGNAGQTNYGAAKMGIAAFTIIASLELARYGVTVNAIAPGFIATDMTDALGDTVAEGVIQQISLGRLRSEEHTSELQSH